MKKSLFFPATLATFAAVGGLLTLAHNSDAQDARENRPQTRGFRFEFKDDGSGPRFFMNGREVPADDVNPDDFFPKEFRRFFGSGGDGANPLEDLPRRFDPLERDDAPGGEPDIQKLMDEMLRRLRPGAEDGGPGRLGFGPIRPDGGPSRHSKHHLGTLSEWRPLVKNVRESTARVLKDGAQAALATIVSADGYALTKASEVDGGKIECEFHDGRIVAATVVDRLEAYDLALLKLEASGLKPVTFSNAEAPVGTLVAAVNTQEDATATGVVSVASRSLDEKTKGFLGVRMSPGQEVEKGVLVEDVIEGGAAKAAGILAGDIILSVNGEEINYPDKLQRRIAALKPDEQVSVTVKRGNEEKTFTFTLGNRGQMPPDALQDRRVFDPTAQMGSTLSRNASGYPKALQTDLALQAEDVGGPVINVEGAVIGMNIARAERVSTFMIPGDVLNSLLADVKNGRFTLARDANTLRAEMQKHEAAVKAAQEALKAAEAKRQELQKALEQLESRKQE